MILAERIAYCRALSLAIEARIAKRTRRQAPTPPPAPREGAPPMSATQDFARLRDAYRQQHGCTIREASDAINKQHPDLYTRHRTASPQRVPVAKQEQQLVLPPPTAGQQRLAVLKQQVQARHPDWSDGQVL